MKIQDECQLAYSQPPQRGRFRYFGARRAPRGYGCQWESNVRNRGQHRYVYNCFCLCRDCVFNGTDDIYSVYTEDTEHEHKVYNNMPCSSADSTFVSNPFSQATGPLPAREDYLGPCNFSVLLDATSTAKNKWAVRNSLCLYALKGNYTNYLFLVFKRLE